MSLINISRRSFVFGGAGASAVAATSAQAALTPYTNSRKNWISASAPDFALLRGDEFSFATADGFVFDASLSDAEKGRSGSRRPLDLPRPESVVLSFAISDATAERLSRLDQIDLKIWHADLGASLLFFTLVPGRHKGWRLEAVLN